MKKLKKLLVAAAALCVACATAVGLAACGNSGPVASYTKTYTIANVQELPTNGVQFFKSDTSALLAMEATYVITVTLDIYGDDHYELTSDGYTFRDGARIPVEDESGFGLVLLTEARGTYTQDGDEITISKATNVTYTIETSTLSQLFINGFGLTYNEATAETCDGVWTEADTPDVLNQVPETVFTVNPDTDAIVTWVVA